MGYLLLLFGIVYFVWRGIFILNNGEARRWEVIPFFGILGASILGQEKVHGIPAKVAGILHLAMGAFCLIALIIAGVRS